jgi:hypothetical protein
MFENVAQLLIYILQESDMHCLQRCFLTEKKGEWLGEKIKG